MSTLDLYQPAVVNIEQVQGDTVDIQMNITYPASYTSITAVTDYGSEPGVVACTCTNSFSAGNKVHIRNAVVMTELNDFFYVRRAAAGSFAIDLTPTNDYIAGAEAGACTTAFDFASYTVKMEVKEAKDDVANVRSWTTSSEITLATGQIDIDVTAANMATMAVGEYFYDIELTDASTDVVETWFEGTFTVVQGVTD